MGSARSCVIRERIGGLKLLLEVAQYGGSEAHSTIFKRERGDWEYATAIGDKLTTLRRYYSNTYTDSDKQDALNLFLGNFVPAAGQPAIWDLDSDYYLHSGEPCPDTAKIWAL